MIGASCVCAGVAVRGVVAAPDMAALEADAQVEPLPADPQAVLAPCDLRRQLVELDSVEVGAGDAYPQDDTGRAATLAR